MSTGCGRSQARHRDDCFSLTAHDVFDWFNCRKPLHQNTVIYDLALVGESSLLPKLRDRLYSKINVSAEPAIQIDFRLAGLPALFKSSVIKCFGSRALR